MLVDFSSTLMDLDGTDALERKLDKATIGDNEPKASLVPLTAASAVMQALNNLDDKKNLLARYEIQKKIRAKPEAVELGEKEPELVREAVEKTWPPFVYGQICELLNLT